MIWADGVWRVAGFFVIKFRVLHRKDALGQECRSCRWLRIEGLQIGNLNRNEDKISLLRPNHFRCTKSIQSLFEIAFEQ
jgi:hypothetical protein